MSFFQWNDSYRVGSPEIDTQHRKLFELADNLHAAMAGGHGKQVLQKTLDDLIDYTRHHFEAEENMMLKSSYPEYRQHKAQHDALTSKVVRFRQQVAAGEVVVTIDILNFLKDWLVSHIGEMDKKIGVYLSQKQPAA